MPRGRQGHGGRTRQRHGAAHRHDAGLRPLPRSGVGGVVRGLPHHRARAARGHAQRVSARLRHDRELRHRGVHRQQEEARPVQLLQGRDRRRQGRRLRPRHPADATGARAARRRRGLRPREARHPAARAGRVEQVDDRAIAEEGARALLAHRRRRALHVRVAGARGARSRRERPRAVPHARGAAAAHSRRVARQGGRRARPVERAPPRERRGRPRPRVPLPLQAPARSLQRRLGQGRRARARAAVRALGEGPRRHRHVPAQGREEPGLDRADGRHQLPQDRRVRLGQRPARVQLRRRVQHRQPGDRRVRRGAQARRGVPLRSARRLAGAQGQAEEVRADRHRRGHHRPHQRGRVQEAALQRVHGGAARPHHQDRHPVHHEDRRGDSHLREGLQRSQGARQARRPPHARGGRDVGRAHAPRGPEEAQPVTVAEAQALRRQGAAGLHAGHGEGASQGGEARGNGGHQPALRPGQDLQRARRRRRRGDDQPLHGAERAREGAAPPLAAHPRGHEEALRGAHRGRQARVRGDRQERGPARHQRGRGRHSQARGQLHRQHQGLHAEGARPQSLHRAGRRARRAPDAVHRGEDRHPRRPQGRLPPRDHELHRRARGRGQEVRVAHQRPAAPRARAQALRGPEGLDQAPDARVGRRRQGDAGEDRHHQDEAHQVLRLQ